MPAIITFIILVSYGDWKWTLRTHWFSGSRGKVADIRERSILILVHSLGQCYNIPYFANELLFLGRSSKVSSDSSIQTEYLRLR